VCRGFANRNLNILINHTKYKKWQRLPEENVWAMVDWQVIYYIALASNIALC